MTQQRGCKYREQKIPLPPPPLQGLNWKSYHIEMLMIGGGPGAGGGGVKVTQKSQSTKSKTDIYPEEGLWMDQFIKGKFGQTIDLLVNVQFTDIKCGGISGNKEGQLFGTFLGSELSINPHYNTNILDGDA